MFDIGFSELFILIVIALLVLGPEKMPAAVRRTGLILGKIKASWNGLQTEINRELEADELRKRIQVETNSVQQTLNNGFDIDAYNERILEQEKKIREGIQREANGPNITTDQTQQTGVASTETVKDSSATGALDNPGTSDPASQDINKQ